ncbi:class I SAM-dependent methyltransferase [Marinobacterium litorale]|uniref:class I SAM-dependent methyltransferase n=1 Tax=Marinobacterium litorale TaxID=404770 RepID=UPI0003FAB3DE|nr:class I SAM-dependent methyltransferase [Marinobacterium litorale]
MNDIPSFIELEFCTCPNGCVPRDEHVLSGRDHLHGLEGTYTIVECLTCGLQRTNPRPTRDTIGYYYPSTYTPYNHSQERKKHKSNFAYKLAVLLGLENRCIKKKPPGNLLDIGCANGAYINEMQDKGWKVKGIEFSSHAENNVVNSNLDILYTDIYDLRDLGKYFDVVTMWMVLEHMHAPTKILKKIRNWISDDGILVISIPDANSLCRRIFRDKCYDIQLPTHLYHFNKKSIIRVLQESGYEITNVRWQKNPNTIIESILIYTNKGSLINSLFRWIKNSRKALFLRAILSFFLGITHQSARIEIIARPNIRRKI